VNAIHSHVIAALAPAIQPPSSLLQSPGKGRKGETDPPVTPAGNGRSGWIIRISLSVNPWSLLPR
jgi:hypothetical protein